MTPRLRIVSADPSGVRSYRTSSESPFKTCHPKVSSTRAGGQMGVSPSVHSWTSTIVPSAASFIVIVEAFGEAESSWALASSTAIRRSSIESTVSAERAATLAATERRMWTTSGRAGTATTTGEAGEPSGTETYTRRSAGPEVLAIQLELETRTEGDWTILDVVGEVDLYTAPSLRDKLVSLIDGGAMRLLVNLVGVGFMDSSGLGVLVGGLKRSKERGGDLALACPEGPPLKVLSITGLDKVFPVYRDVASALRS